jgi:hypothetical protein
LTIDLWERLPAAMKTGISLRHDRTKMANAEFSAVKQPLPVYAFGHAAKTRPAPAAPAQE